ncbi:MAG: hypothetical protein ACE5FM_08380 [Methyloligellaceae bacterium]
MLRLVPVLALIGAGGAVWGLKASNDRLRASLAISEAQFETCKTDYLNLIEDARDDAKIDNTPLDDLLRTEWLFQPSASQE